ncbi:MAG: cytochrome bc complex cytochrome b subunit [Cyanobacteria bacterium HKST-UBA06]|nr:cytochrome bc complex cytochrome b subunit [Cyanobacteria bacterium HKST-UBA04]MCA9806322.1 cytochrome bc complex cytochrome b subunit [Cyanobacteria bacterium HKST-UBA06]
MGTVVIGQKVNSLIDSVKRYFTDRLAKIDIFDETQVAKQETSPWYQLGGFVYLFWMITVVSGLFLVAFYIPTIYQAYDSIELIKESPLLSIIRGMHKYGGDAIIIAATLRCYRIWFKGEYKNKGEFNFIIAMITLLAAMYSGLTGYLLIWNQRAFWATKVFATFPTYLDIAPAVNQWFLPHITGLVTSTIGTMTHQGMNTSQILLGGSSIGQATMTRFFSLHFAFSLIMLVATELYFYANRAKRINLNRWQVLVLILMLIFTSVVLPAESGSRANPEVTPLPILSDWYFLALYQLLKYMDPYWATLWTVAIPFGFIAISFLDFGQETNPWRRPIFTMGMIIGFIDFIVFSVLIIFNQADINTHPPFWYAQMILMFTIGELWHFALYRQMNVWLWWLVPNVLFSFWYFFMHVIPKPLPPESLQWIYNVQVTGSIPENMGHHPWLTMWLFFTLALVALTAWFYTLLPKSGANAEGAA